MRGRTGALAAKIVACAVGASALAGCPGGHGEGSEVASAPADVRADYEVFAQRCSKCHPLSRPLESGITDDAFWKEYVERMRRQPGSGIAPSDEPAILRFLHYFSLEQKRRRAGGAEDGG